MGWRSVGVFENRKYINSHSGFSTASPEGKGKLLGKKFLATIRNQFVNCWHRFDTFRNCWVFPRFFLEVSSSLFVARLNTQMDSWSIIYPRSREACQKRISGQKVMEEKTIEWMVGTKWWKSRCVLVDQLLVVLVTTSSIKNLSPKNWLCLEFGKWTGFDCRDLGVQYSTCGQTNLWHKLGVLYQSLVSEPVKVDSGSNIGPLPFWSTPSLRRGVLSIFTTQTWSGEAKKTQAKTLSTWNISEFSEHCEVFGCFSQRRFFFAPLTPSSWNFGANQMHRKRSVIRRAAAARAAPGGRNGSLGGEPLELEKLPPQDWELGWNVFFGYLNLNFVFFLNLFFGGEEGGRGVHFFLLPFLGCKFLLDAEFESKTLQRCQFRGCSCQLFVSFRRSWWISMTWCHTGEWDVKEVVKNTYHGWWVEKHLSLPSWILITGSSSSILTTFHHSLGF